MSFSACFDLGNVTMKVPARGSHVPGNNSIVIQYEAVVPEERLDMSEPEHVHSYGVIFQYGDAEKNVIVYEREAKFAERKSMPVSGTWLPRKHDFFSHFIFRLFVFWQSL